MEADNDNELPRTRAEAKEVGSKHYFTGEPCKYGHVAARRVDDCKCVECCKDRARKWRAANPERLREQGRLWRAANPERRKQTDKEWRAANPEKANAPKRKWTENNAELAASLVREWEARNPDKKRAHGRKSDAKRRSKPKGKIDNAISNGIWKALRGTKAGRSWEALVGYTLADLMAHLESRFQPGMTFENYGEWHIDHITPKAAFNYETPDDIDFKRCWALSNLQPLWALDNMSKKDKMAAPFQPSLALSVNDSRPAKNVPA